MSKPLRAIPPHGGTLIDRTLRGTLREAALERAAHLPRVTLDAVALSDLELIGNGAFSPLTGFMDQMTAISVIEDMYLPNGLVWSIPITLRVSEEQASQFKIGQELALEDGDGRLVGLLELSDMFRTDKEREAELVFRTTSDTHPGVARLYRQGDICLAGEVWQINGPQNPPFGEFRLNPSDLRKVFASRGWRRVVGFQTRNPIHRAHEYIQKAALEIVDGLLIHPLVGETKSDDIPAEVRMRSYQALLRDYYPPERTMLAVFPAAMRYAGPREAIFHALVRKNYGCTHFIVGRDHAGVGNFYGTYDAQLIFDDFAPHELGITPLFFEHTFFCKTCGGIVSAKTCPHTREHHVTLSGTAVRDMLSRGELPPPEISRPEVALILAEAYRAAAAEQNGRNGSPDGTGGSGLGGPQPDTHPPPEGEKEAGSRQQEASNGPQSPPRMLVIGLDCAAPELVFEQWRDELPTLRRLMEQGIYGRMESCIPAITVPAWACMMSSHDPGQLGVYGFRNRADHSYHAMTTATSRAITVPRLWDILGAAGKHVGVIGVPQTFPVSPVNGELVSCFLTPSARSQYTYPPTLKDEIGRWVKGEFLMDVMNFRSEDKAEILREIYTLAEQHFTVCKRLLERERYDFFMTVDMGVDRIHHGFWKAMDPRHPNYVPNNPFANAIREYYHFIDGQIAELLERIDDDTIVFVVSDHGGKVMLGGICLNEWLIQEGYLVLHEYPSSLVPLERCQIDWSRTVAWGAGGYYGRLFLNVEGREPEGIVPPDQYERVRDEIAAKLEALPDHTGAPLATRAYRPDKLYHEATNVPPDLIIYFDDLNWRSVGSVGKPELYTFENDTGPDDANHAQYGMFILHNPRQPGGGRRVDDLSIYDIAPTLLHLLGQPVPADMIGQVHEW